MPITRPTEVKALNRIEKHEKKTRGKLGGTPGSGTEKAPEKRGSHA